MRNDARSGVGRRALLCAATTLALCAGAAAQDVDPDWSENGIASWYGPGFAGNPTASGEIYNPDHLTAAHKTLPLGTLVRVYNVENDREMIVRINDRGPFVHGRVIDLSRAAAEVLGFRDDGLAQVELSVVVPPRTRSAGEALFDAVGRAADAGLSAILPAQSTAGPEGHVAAAEIRSTTLAEDPAPSPHRNTSAIDDGYFLQVGAFRDSFNADDLIRRIEQLGMSPVLRQSDDVVRVLVGPFENRRTALSAQHDLGRSGIDAFLRTSGR